MIPSTINYPDALDTNENLFLVHDDLRVTLIEDYAPGDTTINVNGSAMGRFPLSGFITLTDQCSTKVNRAISFYYGSRTSSTFDKLELLSGFTDTAKIKNVTNVTQNVMAEHHNSLKDAIIAIEEFIGVKGTTDLKPLGATMEGRLNFLRKLVLKPRAWFTANKRIGIVPMKVKFTDLSFRNPVSFLWDFGDNTTSSVTTVSATTVAPDISNILVNDLDGKDITKTYHNPGIYSVTLTVTNEFGTDTVIFPDFINARVAAPSEAIVSITANANQTITTPTDSYLLEHLIPGIINARAGTLIDLTVTNNGENPLDPVDSYTWKLNDTLTHSDSESTNASYNVGGFYDIKIRVDTSFGSYRITTLEDAINIIERENLFLSIFDPNSLSGAITQNVTNYEFGLISETFKTKNRGSTPVTRDYRFLSSSLPEYTRQKREFLKNNSIAQRGTVFSGDNGTALIYWSEGAGPSAAASAQTIRLLEYEGFSNVWRTTSSLQYSRPWNWIGLNSSSNIYILFGGITGSITAGTSPTNQDRLNIEMTGLTNSTTTFTSSNYRNGAEELMTNVGTGTYGHFSVYRTTYKDNNGYIARNDGGGIYFRIKSFYRTEGTTLTDGLNLVRKLTDIPGSAKLEGNLITLSNGIYFFNNSGEIAVYSPATNTWAVGGPGVGSVSFRSLQDSTVSTYDEVTNTLVAASDSDRRAYLSFDYSNNAFVKFTESDLSFTSLPSRPSGEQFVAGVF